MLRRVARQDRLSKLFGNEMSPNWLASLCAPFLLIVIASCGRIEQEAAPPLSDAGEASSPNACGGATPLTFGGTLASPGGTPCTAPVLDGERGVTQARVRGCPVSA